MIESLFPIIEIFGPTIQGEGPHAGRVVAFIRTGGCDYRCDWCDSMYAVDPVEVRNNAERLTAAQIIERLPAEADTIVLSGGNPALMPSPDLAVAIRESGRSFHVETQGSKWRSWLGLAELLIVSPKPPSSSMSSKAESDLPAFLKHWRGARADSSSTAPVALKFVIADHADLEWALSLRESVDAEHEIPLYLSALTPPECSLSELAASYRNLCELVLESADARSHSPVVLPQLHVVAWGHARAV